MLSSFKVNQIPQNDEEKSCMRALFLTDPRDDRKNLEHDKGKRADKTCEWIKSNATYISWLEGDSSNLLWLSGGPGKGKTMLSIFLAEQLEQKAKQSPNITFLQFFCDNKDEKRNTATTIMRGLIYQLLQSQPELFKYILPEFFIRKEALFTEITAVCRIFEAMIRDPIHSLIYCVIDGLDECMEDSLKLLLSNLKEIFQAGPGRTDHHLKIILVSREHPTVITNELSSFLRVRLDGDADKEINYDILTFIDIKIKELEERSKLSFIPYKPSLWIHVREVFGKKAEGTFLWVGLTAKALENVPATEVRAALKLFPPGLDGLYARLLRQIPSDEKDIAAKLLRWVVLAPRPLSLAELGAAIDAPFNEDYDLVDVVRGQVLRCGHLLTIMRDRPFKEGWMYGWMTRSKDEADPVEMVNLVHQSAKDYLLRDTPDSGLDRDLKMFRISQGDGNLEMTERCLNYLKSDALQASLEEITQDLDEHWQKFPLIGFAVARWPEYARTIDQSESVFNMTRRFLRDNSPIRETWWSLIRRDQWSRDNNYSSTKLLHMASYLGITPIIENMILPSGTANINQIDHDLGTPLHYAVESECKPVVQLLLENGADVNLQNKSGKTALHLIKWWSDESNQILELLLQAGANANAKNNDGQTAFHWAALGGKPDTIEILLGKGADINAKDNDGWTALHGAAERGNLDIIQVLLGKGADVNAKDNNRRTALHEAAQWGNLDTVEVLLGKGADINAKDNNGWTALHGAAESDNPDTVEVLLGKGADINAKDNDGQTALHGAAESGNLDTVEVLLGKGADINAKDNDGWTALHGAAERGNLDIIQVLLGKGADINAKDNNGWTALHGAAESGNPDTVEVLLGKGADINAKDNDRQTALHRAAWGGNLETVRFLLKAGADAVAKTHNDGKTPLDFAKEKQNNEMIHLLREATIKARY